MKLDGRLDAQLFTGNFTSPDVPWRHQVAIGGHAYTIDVAQYQRQTVDSLRPFSDGGNDVGENSLNPQALWRRGQIDWSLGANQAYFDEGQTSDKRRFLSSKGVDVWTPRSLTLLKDTTKTLSTTNSGLHLLAVTGYLYLIDGAQVRWSANGGVSWSSANIQAGTGHTTPVTAITSDGIYVYAAMGVDGVHRTQIGTTVSTSFSAVATQNIQYANGRLVGTNNNAIFELTASGSSVAVFSHPNIYYSWDGLASAPNGSYVWGHAGDHSEIYIIGVVDATGQLASPVFAGELPFGETINDIVFYGGLLAITTSAGFRLGNVTSQGGVVVGPVTLIPGGCKDIGFNGRYAWTSWSNFDTGSTGLLRIDLARFVFPLTPAFASDLMATAQGTVTGVTFTPYGGGYAVFAVDGVGVFIPSANFVMSGTLDSGVIRFGVIDPKLLAFFDMRHDAMPAGASIVSTITLDDGSSAVGATSNVTGTVGPGAPVTLNDPSSENPHVVLTLNRGTDPTKAPVLHRWLLKGLPTPTPIDTIRVPLILKDTVATIVGDGDDTVYDTKAEFEFLRSLVSSRQVVVYQEGARQERVYVEALEIKPEKWNTARTFFEGVVIAQLKTLG